MRILRLLGLAPSERDTQLMELVTRSYNSVQVVGRGTVKIDPQEVRSSEEFKNAQARARTIVDNNLNTFSTNFSCAFAAFDDSLKYTDQALNKVDLSFVLKTVEKEFTMGYTKVAVREDGTYHVELSAEIGKDLTKEQSEAFNAFLKTLH